MRPCRDTTLLDDALVPTDREYVELLVRTVSSAVRRNVGGSRYNRKFCAGTNYRCCVFAGAEFRFSDRTPRGDLTWPSRRVFSSDCGRDIGFV